MQILLVIITVKNLTAARAEKDDLLVILRVMPMLKEFGSESEISFWRFNVVRRTIDCLIAKAKSQGVQRKAVKLLLRLFSAFTTYLRPAYSAMNSAFERFGNKFFISSSKSHQLCKEAG